jgi:hypothetical protein
LSFAGSGMLFRDASRNKLIKAEEIGTRIYVPDVINPN